MTITRANSELIAFAEAVRGEEWADDLSLALAAAANTGWTWERAAKYACDLIFRPDSSPRELRDAARDPLRPGPDGSPPPSVDLTAVRARLEEARQRGQGGGAA